MLSISFVPKTWVKRCIDAMHAYSLHSRDLTLYRPLMSVQNDMQSSQV